MTTLLEIADLFDAQGSSDAAKIVRKINRSKWYPSDTRGGIVVSGYPMTEEQMEIFDAASIKLLCGSEVYTNEQLDAMSEDEAKAYKEKLNDLSKKYPALSDLDFRAPISDGDTKYSWYIATDYIASLGIPPAMIESQKVSIRFAGKEINVTNEQARAFYYLVDRIQNNINAHTIDEGVVMLLDVNKVAHERLASLFDIVNSELHSSIFNKIWDGSLGDNLSIMLSADAVQALKAVVTPHKQK